MVFAAALAILPCLVEAAAAGGERREMGGLVRGCVYACVCARMSDRGGGSGLLLLE